MNETLHPVKDAARRLGISVWTLRKKAYDGGVASVKIGAKLLIPESEMDRLVRDRTRPRQVAGTPNRKAEDVAELLEGLGCNPIAGMAKLARDPKNRPELRGRMFAELAQYVYPKRKAAEVSGNKGNPLMQGDWASIMRERRAARTKLETATE
jgi:excisionase family DNA binding protein